MSLVKVSIPGMYNGVSTQNPALRLITQGETQENFIADLVDGLQLRPGTSIQHILSLPAYTGLTSNKIGDTLLHFYLTGDETTPLVVVDDDGTEYTINYDLTTWNSVSVEDYLSAVTTPNKELKLIFLKDTILCLNTTTETSMLETIPVAIPQTTSPQRHTAIITVVGAATGYLYRISLDSLSFSVPNKPIYGDFTAAGTVTNIASNLAANLLSELNTHYTGHGFTVTSTNDKVLIMRETDSNDFTVAISDSYTGTQMTMIKDTVNSTAELPADATFGTIAVQFKVSEGKYGYYMKFNYSTKIWEEAVGYSLYYRIDPSTMPIKFTVDTTAETVDVEWVTWSNRLIGDEDTCPTPSFIGQPIKNIFFYKNRLGFITNDGIILSKSGDLFNFWNDTALDVLDTDPIDYDVLSTKHVELDDVISTSAGLFLKSKNTQYIVHSGDQPFTPTSIIIDEVSNYRLNTCNLLRNESSLYLVSQTGSVWEYVIDGGNLNTSGNDISLHVKGYLPTTLWKAVTIGTSIFYLDSNDNFVIYLYQYTISGEKVQNSWSKLVFENEIVDIDAVDNQLYLLMRSGNSDEAYSLKLDFDNSDSYLTDLTVHLDGIASVSGVYDDVTNTTSFTLPITDTTGFSAGSEYVILDLDNERQLNNVTFTDSATLTVSGDYSGLDCIAGKKFLGKYRFSQQYARDPQTGVGDPTVKLQYKRLTLSYQNAYTFDVVTQATGRSAVRQTYINRPIGWVMLGTTTLASGDFKTLIFGDKSTTIDLEVYGWTSCHFIGAIIEGLYVSNSRSI